MSEHNKRSLIVKVVGSRVQSRTMKLGGLLGALDPDIAMEFAGKTGGL